MQKTYLIKDYYSKYTKTSKSQHKKTNKRIRKLAKDISALPCRWQKSICEDTLPHMSLRKCKLKQETTTHL